MTLAIVGTGLVSPFGLTPAQHAFFVRAGIGLNPPSAFLRDGGEPVAVHHCPWLGAKLPIADRLAALGKRATDTALAALTERRKSAHLLACVSALRPGFTDTDRAATTCALEETASAPLHRALTGAASFFEALGEAEQLVTSERERVVVIVAVDSFVSLDAIRAELDIPVTTWVREPPAPSEAAAVVVVMESALAQERGIPVIGTVCHAGTLVGSGSDEDDAMVDGAALTALIEELPVLRAPIARVYGQGCNDLLRQHEWTYAAARNVERFHPRVSAACIEAKIGRLGAAAGAVQLVYGLAAERHHAAIEHEAGAGPFLAWAISPDGTRGLCAATATWE